MPIADWDCAPWGAPPGDCAEKVSKMSELPRISLQEVTSNSSTFFNLLRKHSFVVLTNLGKEIEVCYAAFYADMLSFLGMMTEG